MNVEPPSSAIHRVRQSVMLQSAGRAARALPVFALVLLLVWSTNCIGKPSYSYAPVLEAPAGPGTVSGGGGAYVAVIGFGMPLDFAVMATDDTLSPSLSVTATVTGGTLTAAQAGFTSSFPASVAGTNSVTLELFGTADMVGAVELTVVADNGRETASWVLEIRITNPPQLGVPTGPGTVGGSAPSYSASVVPTESLALGITATDADVDDTLTLTATVTGGSLTAAQVGFSISFPASTTGASPLTLNLAGTAGEIGGTIELTFHVVDAAGASDTVTLTIAVVVSEPQLGVPTGPGTISGSAPSYGTTIEALAPLAASITATDDDGGKSLTLTASVSGGSLSAAQAGFTTSFPASTVGTSPLTLDLAGTAGTTAGTIELTFLVEDSYGGSDTATLTITIQAEAPAITNAPAERAIVGEPWSFTPTATGTPTPTLSVVGHPSWLAWNGTTLSGTPAPSDRGNTGTITVTAANGVTPDATLNFTIAVCDWVFQSVVSSNNFRNVWAESPSNIFAVGFTGTIRRFNGTSWNSMNSNTTRNLRGVWGSSGSNVFAVGEWETFIHYTGGSAWNVMTVNSNHMYGIWGSASNNIVAVGAGGWVAHYNGSSWSAGTGGTPTTQPLYGVWGTAANNVFVVGADGTILHFNGSSYSAMTSPTSTVLTAVWGSSATDVFAVGWGGTILHYDGTSWSTMTSGTTQSLHGVWGSSSTDVFAVGANGTILHFDGNTWSSLSSPVGDTLYGIHGTSSTHIVAVGGGTTPTILVFGP